MRFSPPVPRGYRVIELIDQDGGPHWIAVHQSYKGALPPTPSSRQWNEGPLFAYAQWVKSLPGGTLLWDGQRWKDADQCVVLGGGDPAS